MGKNTSKIRNMIYYIVFIIGMALVRMYLDEGKLK